MLVLRKRQMRDRRLCTEIKTAPGRLYFAQRHGDLGTALDSLIHDAIAFRKFEQLVELILCSVCLDVESQTDFTKSDWRVLGHA